MPSSRGRKLIFDFWFLSINCAKQARVVTPPHRLTGIHTRKNTLPFLFSLPFVTRHIFLLRLFLSASFWLFKALMSSNTETKPARSFLDPAPEPKSKLGYYRQLSPSCGVRVSPICLGVCLFHSLPQHHRPNITTQHPSCHNFTHKLIHWTWQHSSAQSCNNFFYIYY